jgi:hypothetical protein
MRSSGTGLLLVVALGTLFDLQLDHLVDRGFPQEAVCRTRRRRMVFCPVPLVLTYSYGARLRRTLVLSLCHIHHKANLTVIPTLMGRALDFHSPRPLLGQAARLR